MVKLNRREFIKGSLAVAAGVGIMAQNHVNMKKIPLQYGKGEIEITIPDNADLIKGVKVKPLPKPAKAIRQSLNEPIGTAALSELAKGKDNAAIVVSDNTRPVPYKGPDGILEPIVDILKQSRIRTIKVIVACGTHRPLKEHELKDMLGETAFQNGVQVINHICTDQSVLRNIGSTSRTPDVTVNRHYLEADLKILTGLVEPHFMAGFSGGRKSVCPGICGQSVTYGLHSARILNEKNAVSLILKDNPCHEESLQIAKMAGVDFIVNVVINSDKKITGVFSGDLEKAHLAAVEHLRTFAEIKLDGLYDVVVSQAGPGGVNHYQCAKIAVEASRAVKSGGFVIALARLTDPDPIGGENYKKMQKLLTNLGPAGFVERILSRDWQFVPEQWQSQMWAKAFNKLGNCKNFYLCAPKLEHCPEELIPETNVASEIKRLPNETDVDFAGRMMQQTIDKITQKIPNPRMLVLPDGPYTVPVLKRNS